MNKRSVHVSKLRLRIPRSMAGQAAAIARGVGDEILRGLAAATAAETGARRIGTLPPVRVRAGGNDDARDVRRRAATQVAQQVRARGEREPHG